MEDRRMDRLSRRCALRRGAGFGLGMAIVWAAPARAPAKLARDAVKYVDPGQGP